MCGIVFVGGRTLLSKEMAVFEKMLMCDSFRGMHSTGIFAGFRLLDGTDQFKLAKAKLNGFDFVNTQLYEDTVSHTTIKPSVYATGTPTKTIKAPNFVFGHNRYATVGAINAANAHPFQHGHITLAHNGTLTSQELLPDYEKFEVDSENVCYSVYKKGIEWTIQNLDGAFTLVWHDAEKKTVNFIRNKDRPFHLVETVSGDWFGASEEGMVMWLATREKLSAKIKRHFELEVGVQYVFDVSNGGCTLTEQIKHELPTFTRTYSYNSRYDYGYYSTSGSTNSWPDQRPAVTTTPSTGVNKITEANLLLADSGLMNLQLGKKVEFMAYAFAPYATNQYRGKMEGCLPDHSEFVEVHCHGFSQTDFENNATYEGVIVTAYEMNEMLQIIVKDAVKVTPKASSVILEGAVMVVENHQGEASEEMQAMLSTFQLEQEQDRLPWKEAEQQLPSGKMITREEWDSSPNTVCGNCDHPIPFEAVSSVTEYGGSYLCSECREELEREAEEEEGAQSGDTFCCTGCAEEFMESDRSPDYPLMCTECASMFKPATTIEKITPLRRTAKNGMVITLAHWNVINYCRICNQRIPFSDVESVPFIGSTPVCLDCETKLKK